MIRIVKWNETFECAKSAFAATLSRVMEDAQR